jgi:aryl-alcohol dehydrogenase-like predicted oxidoreductase
MGMSWAYDAAGRDDERSTGVIRRAPDLGVTLLDTSDQYGPFVNESLVGAALEGRRDDVVLATKGGLVVRPDGSTTRDGSPGHLRRAHAASLERLRTEHVDLYQLHRIDPAVPLERSWETLAGFAAEGSALQLGLSEASVDEIERAQTIHPVASVQTELSLWTREARDEVLPYCRENGITFIAYSPLGRGFLSGRFSRPDDLPDGDWRRRSPRFGPDAIEANRALLGPVHEAAESLGVTPAQVALAWVLAQGEHVVAIPGTKNPDYLQENVAAARLVLPADVLATLDELPEPVGARY